ncbi:hypothetical protein V757_10260 [Pelistega indica]|uniref:7-carboxy-7-deazaguanine synthase n=1 Tax=Pelistega indica TaxID=1414851 RepID=V8FVY5_9BURK|nr:7-carboxy-7-deazaguanine synthase QueE [Pelistega indica]ETD68325.1 hypothetical protein V757_10260 [Pelistega indica]
MSVEHILQPAQQLAEPFSIDEQHPQYRIVEIFESLQGEGFNTGMPAIFIRLGKCSLACSWCDTDYLKFELKSLNDIFAMIDGYTAKNIIITGGEPTIHPYIEQLLDALKLKGYHLCIESNALHAIPLQIEYVAVSPKYCYSEKYAKECISHADEVRIVMDPDKLGSPEKGVLPLEKEQRVHTFIEWCEEIANKISAQHYYLSPLEVDGQMNILDTITAIGLLNERAKGRQKDTKNLANNFIPHWQLSLQTHKFAHIQ